MTNEPVLLSSDTDGVRTLTLNRPQRKNAISGQLWAALRTALGEIADDREIRAVIVTGAGESFCAGADIADAEGVDDFPDPTRELHTINETSQRLHELPVPTLAKVRGVAVGAGWNLALACDLVVATPEARFSQIFARRALSLDCGGSWLLPKLVGLQQAKRLALLAEMIQTPEAHELGLVTWVRSGETIDAFADDMARRLAAGPPLALRQTKALLNAGADRTLPEALDAEAQAAGLNLSGPDVIEAFAAWAEKRDPVYTGAANSASTQ
ncbi:enoyl-CoA hydratase-related protein [Nocardia vinacea]|uniref:Enoyl-CoA hydratase-related protein n=1 Tax=Nocardia vinacea TaxID=96468 RepID=A0ABZ1YS58_9NOCA|nr:enoyl-CoA hydratase-related protein [Nocardia vinacea]